MMVQLLGYDTWVDCTWLWS